MAEHRRGHPNDNNPPEYFSLSQLTFLVAELQELLAEALEGPPHGPGEQGFGTHDGPGSRS